MTTTVEESGNLVDISKVETALFAKHEELKAVLEKANGEAQDAKNVSIETRSAIDGIAEKMNELGDRIQEMEQRGASLATIEHIDTLGEEFTKTDAFKDFQEGRTGRARMDVKTAIINATGASQPLVPADRLGGIHTTENRRLRIRDILPSSATTSNLIEFVRENVFTNSAGPQIAGSPQAFENVTKPESGITFTLVSEPVQTLAHWIPASKQVIEDSVQLQSFISNRLTYGLKLYEESQLLTGTGANGQLNGINTQATAWGNESPNITNKIDIVRSMIKQCEVANYEPDAIILNPQDWYDIDISKTASSATDVRYVVGNPRSMSPFNLWGIPVVVTNAQTSGTATVGAFQMGCEIKDRNMSTVEVSRENSDNFVKNMVTVLAEERIALCVYRTESFITGSI